MHVSHRGVKLYLDAELTLSRMTRGPLIPPMVLYFSLGLIEGARKSVSAMMMAYGGCGGERGGGECRGDGGA